MDHLNTMSNQVSARKWRPQNFSEVIGQSHVVQALSNALTQKRLHHAYLFTGTRGVGKTTIARILAKCLNCENGITASPCGVCSTCREISEGRFVDLLEIDAASRTRVEDTRDLLDNVQYMPTRGRYKVYLIDEVHMLSGHSFNALLKTLEEPPAHVIFILATTDPQRLPVTVLSRCLQFHLKKMPIEQISQQLSAILEHEKINFETQALKSLAKAADGSMRDALSLLDQAIAYSDQSLTATAICDMLGVVEQQHILQLIQNLVEANGINILSIIADLQQQGADFDNVLEELLSLLQQIAVIQVIPESTPDNEELAHIAANIDKETIQLYYQIGLTGRRDLPLAPDPRTGFEMLMLRMLAFRPSTPLDHGQLTQSIQAQTPAAKIQQASSHSSAKTQTPSMAADTLAQQPAPTTAAQPEAPASKSAPKTETTAETTSKAAPIINDKHGLNWSELLLQLGLKGIALNIAQHCIIADYKDNKLSLLIEPNQMPMLTDNQTNRIADALSQHFDQPTRVDIQAGEKNSDCPANIAERARQAEQQQAETSINTDPNVQKILAQFDATIAPNSITPHDETR